MQQTTTPAKVLTLCLASAIGHRSALPRQPEELIPTLAAAKPAKPKPGLRLPW